jgi:hypothetical protein
MSLLNKRFIFTVTTGHSGTNFLADAAACLPRVLALHEPKPKYDRVLNMVQVCPQVAGEFLLKKKLPAIKKSIGNKQVYIETSHLFCKGFLEAWLDMKDLPVPDLVCLDSDSRKTALSMFQLNTIPGRNWEGLKYLLYPDSKNLMTRLNGHETMSDYQLCYWYCLEIEQRKKAYKKLVESKGGCCIHTSIDKLRSDAGFEEFRQALDLPELNILRKRKLRRIQGRIINAKRDLKKRPIPNVKALAKMEQAVKMSTEIAGFNIDTAGLQVKEYSQLAGNDYRSLALGLAQLKAVANSS